MPQPQQEYFTVTEAARYLGITEAMLRLRLSRKKVPTLRWGKKRILLDRATLDSMVRERAMR